MTTTQKMIKEMEESGFPVKINHFRYTKDGKFIRTYNNSRSKEKYGPKPEYSVCGGLTTVQIGLIAEPFSANCSKKDHFCFKDGTYLAVSRAYAFFKEQCVEKEQCAAIQQEVPESKSCCGGKCCGEKKGSFYIDGKVLKEKTLYHIVCFDPKTNAFVGYIPKDDPYASGSIERSGKTLSRAYSPSDYTTKDEDIADFETQEAAEKCLICQAEKVVRADYRVVTQVKVTEL